MDRHGRCYLHGGATNIIVEQLEMPGRLAQIGNRGTKLESERFKEIVDVAAAPPRRFYTDTKLIFSHRKRLSESSRSSPRRPGRTDLFPNGSV